MADASTTQDNLLAQPLTLPNGSVLRNRIAKSAMSEALASYDNHVTPLLPALYRRWAQSGIGLLITGNVMIDRRALGEPGNVVLEDDADLPLLRQWAEAATAQGVQIWVQLNHPGKQSPKGLNDYNLSPSAIPFRKDMAAFFDTPRETTPEQIKDIIARFGRSAALAKQAGGKLNDVVLALASGVVRRYLLQYGTLPAKSLTAAVPISLREEGNTEANNQVFGMICSIATNIADPKARLEAIIAQSTKSKEMSHPLRALMPQVSNISMLGAPIIVQILALLYSRSDLSDVLPPAANITVSNVPGPRQTLYAAGAELLHIFPVSISTHGQALNITVQSYRDQLDFGFIVGANIIPHVQVMCDMLPEEFAALEAAYAPPASDVKGAAE